MDSDAGRVRRALVVEDDPDVSAIIEFTLAEQGFDVIAVDSGLAGVQAVRDHQPDLVTLDLGLPGLDGVEVCRQLRTFSDCYVIMLTARAKEVDVLRGLRIGADDYMTKPFSPRELVTRANTLLRRPRRLPEQVVESSPVIEIGTLKIDSQSRDVRVGGRVVPLTRTEFDVLAALASRPGTALSRQALIAEVWGPGWVGDEHLVDVHVLHVRKKLGDRAARERFIRTVRGIGYRIGTGT